MDELQGRLRRVLDPLGYGIPRRAVISASSRVVMDKSRAVDETEIGSISEVCSIIFGTEPRHPADLLRRAFTSSSKDSTWQALRDDIVWEYPVTLGLEYVGGRRQGFAGTTGRVSGVCVPETGGRHVA